MEDLRQTRLEKRERLEAAGVRAHPERFDRTHTLRAAMDLPEGEQVRVAGRVVQVRRMGKLTFATLQDMDGHLQVALFRDELSADAEESRRLYERFVKDVDRWDFVGVEGTLFRTQTGELTVRVKEWTFLGKSLLPPPNKYQGSRDQETNWRKRYIDLVSNEETRARFRLRSAVVRALREWLDEHGFDEVETPILTSQASGALARPFVSWHNTLETEVVLRIAPETYLKRLIVAGYDRVYEFAKSFRNEGMAASHLQEFTMLEYYAAYWNYEDNMAFTEAMLRHVIRKATGGLTITRGGRAIDFEGEWPRRTLRDLIREHAGIDIEEHPDADSLRAAIAAAGV
ncbi:MAG TPA: amino acid--tRNA ligase-related protein, partial [Longimicrobium sp.]|nr:amino acid--tRNA ligase-related protein [Longimicrobium sp.]